MARATYFCVDAHTCGNPVRVVTGGGPALEGTTMAEKRLDFLAHHDHVRRSLMFEPRGHDQMSGSILYPSSRPDCDTGILFIETSGCLPMCGHGTIGSVTVMLEHGLVRPKDRNLVRLETPAGRVDAHVTWSGDEVASVRIVNIPSYLAGSNLRVTCPDLGELTVDVAYGGNFYAIIDPQENYADLADHAVGDLIRWSPVLRERLNERYSFVHPEDPNIAGVSHIEWTGRPLNADSDARNAVFYGEKAIDRSPCGTGTSARMAQWAARGNLAPGDRFVHESIIGSQFVGRVESVTRVGTHDAIVPSIEGWARVTGLNTIFVDDADPYAAGFVVK